MSLDHAAGACAAAPPQPHRLGSVALVHDYLNQAGGAERVVLAMSRIWPEAPIYTSLYRADSTFAAFGAQEIHTSPLQLLPIDSAFRNLFPLYPAAFRSFGELEQDIVISSSSGWAHAVRTAPHSFHAVYCHAPARWLYESGHLVDVRAFALRPLRRHLREWDMGAARRASLYIANSHEVRRRIEREYGVLAPVVYPPVDVERFRPRERGERLLVVSRLLPYKRVDAIVGAASQAGIGLDVVGTGPAMGQLRRQAGPGVEFHGRLDDRDVVALMERCRALCVAGKEDFGITGIEANAAGKPVVALAAGGSLETVREGVTGTLFAGHDPAQILDAVRRCDRLETAPDELAMSARRFSHAAFEASLLGVLEAAIRAKTRPLSPASG